jgi:ABC-type multidrug transport system ATPase subunit
MTGAEAGAAIDVRHLHKTYGATVAVGDVSFTVAKGEVFGLLGPNGAGKTTTVECVTGLRHADEGQVRILGLAPRARREVWDLIEPLRARGVTILLVTHNMEEAARLCDQVALVDRGRIVAAGTPQELARRVGAGKQVNFTPSVPFQHAVSTST